MSTFFMSKTETSATVLERFPKFIAGAIRSQSHHIANSGDTKLQKIACFTAVVAEHIKFTGALCFASPETLHSRYNQLAPSFGLSEVGRSTFFTIQSTSISSGLVVRSGEHNKSTGRTWRQMGVSLAHLSAMIPAAFAKALCHAKQLAQRVLDYGHYQEEKRLKASQGKGSKQSGNKESWTIRENTRSRDKDKHTGKPDASFYKSRFKEDCDQAYQLQEAARSGAITPAGAKALLGLHSRHGVQIGESFKKFLTFKILNTPSGYRKEGKKVLRLSALEEVEAKIFGFNFNDDEPKCVEPELTAEQRDERRNKAVSMISDFRKAFGLRRR